MTTSSSLAADPTVPLATGRVRGPGGAAALVFGVGLLLVSCAGAVCVGAADLTVEQVARSVAAHLGLGTSPLAPLPDSVVWQLRLPRVLLAAAVGAALALCGCVLQALTRNVLADPYLLGISSGASTGAVAVLVLGLGAGTVGLAGGAFLGGLAAFGLVVLLVGSGVGTSITRVVLTGVAVGQLFAAVSALLLMASGDAQTVRGVTYWLLGSLSGARWGSVGLVAALVAVGGLVLWSRAAALDAFTFGADAAASLGVRVSRTRWLLLVTTALVTAGAVAVSGAIAFVGLVLPHAVRRVVGAAHARLLPACALAGAAFLVWADALARSAFAPQEVPVGVVTALVGAPAFLLVLRSVAR
ncbi:FecCD family ABC transporter permease [Motilibacter aurantiacus]|uniref:FecCD family ABC transporter permease n=1 Tax=Motilibacter aurantiacus TaxID=2714955 RepID=UPI00140C1118|nr:iron chelate uptake ABC transporter family permease subunit [Motilibacter aurantiacus]NHC47507.1 iron chelate uptake ABC transporter family permease subunit [Motilibacter aurantiacus]